ncbi:MAG: L-2-amino-thiazoline-4-carboxylic acid hydrolase [Synergistaceae bacterium]|nr:L-2-amino-thiazoline-4-carboxylic acid hydrolase [Synergistaceae bacterium]
MKENYTEVPLLQQREIEIKVLGPVIRAFAAEFGKEKTYDLVRKTMQEISRNLGKNMSSDGNGLENLKNKCVSKWNEGGALETQTKEDSGTVLSFDVTKCEFANLYRELGFADIGALISCDRDAAFLEGFDPGLELIREKTLMNGDPVCDFCYRKK